MANIIEGKFSAKGKRFGIVVSRFNSLISSKLLEGTFEISQVTKKMVSSISYNALICPGAVIRGATPLFDYVTRGIGQLNLESEQPLTFGILTTDTIEQALEWAGTKSGNKGWMQH